MNELMINEKKKLAAFENAAKTFYSRHDKARLTPPQKKKNNIYLPTGPKNRFESKANKRSIVHPARSKKAIVAFFVTVASPLSEKWSPFLRAMTFGRSTWVLPDCIWSHRLSNRGKAELFFLGICAAPPRPLTPYPTHCCRGVLSPSIFLIFFLLIEARYRRRERCGQAGKERRKLEEKKKNQKPNASPARMPSFVLCERRCGPMFYARFLSHFFADTALHRNLLGLGM